MIKKLLFSTLVLSITSSGFSQTSHLWGLTPELNNGKRTGYGTIYKTDVDGSNMQVEYSFEMKDGVEPGEGLVQTSNGKIYGVCTFGGRNENGTLFEYNPTTKTKNTIIDFDGTNQGSQPMALMLASNNKIYGVTNRGGVNNYGALFEFDPSTNTLTKKADFSSGLAIYPNIGITEASNGKLYGLAETSGGANKGVIYEYDLSTNTLTKKYDFSQPSVPNNGEYPSGILFLASNNKLYGLTGFGGTNGMGTLFEYDPITNTYAKKADFTPATNGSRPRNNLVQIGNNLYGIASGGGANGDGTIFAYNLTNETLTKNFDFEMFNGNIGGGPEGNLLVDNNKIYSVTRYMHNLFEFDPATNTFVKKLRSGGSSAISLLGNAHSTLFKTSTGEIIGLFNKGGFLNKGAIAEYGPNLDTVVAYSPCGIDNEGLRPKGSLIQASNGMLYGLAEWGGTHNTGVLFEFNPTNGTYTKKADFETATTGEFPTGTLLEGTTGKLYGTTKTGGSGERGTLFEFDINTGALTTKFSFNGTNGSRPSDLMKASNGKLYGVTAQDDDYDHGGTLFEYDITTNTLTTHHRFTIYNEYPVGQLIETSNNIIYGTLSWEAASGYASMFEYNITTDTYTQKATFNGSTGSSPDGYLTLINNKLYGTAKNGGANAHGILFEYDITADTVINKFDFLATTVGEKPQGGVMLSSNGNLYGTAYTGGVYNAGFLNGTIFEYDLTADTCVSVHNFNGTNGRRPRSTKLIEVVSNTTNLTEINTDKIVKVYPNPTNDILYVNGINLLEQEKVFITTIQGKRINITPNHASLNVQDLKPGVYLLTIVNKQQHITTKFVRK